MQKLSSIQDQLNQVDKKRVRSLIEKLLKLSNNSEGAYSQFVPLKDPLQNLMKDYKYIDSELNKGISEAKDNYKWISSLERFLDVLEHGSPKNVRDILPLLMNSIKMIYTIAK